MDDCTSWCSPDHHHFCWFQHTISQRLCSCLWMLWHRLLTAAADCRVIRYILQYSGCDISHWLHEGGLHIWRNYQLWRIQGIVELCTYSHDAFVRLWVMSLFCFYWNLPKHANDLITPCHESKRWIWRIWRCQLRKQCNLWMADSSSKRSW